MTAKFYLVSSMCIYSITLYNCVYCSLVLDTNTVHVHLNLLISIDINNIIIGCMRFMVNLFHIHLLLVQHKLKLIIKVQ